MRRDIANGVVLRLALVLAVFSFECGRLQGQQENCRFCSQSGPGAVR